MIPIRISPLFWLTAAFIGFIKSHSLIGTLIWMGIIFVSVLVHEFGHALTAKAFGQRPRIELVALGGLTIPEGKRLRLWKEFIVIFNGPLFGFSLFVIAWIILETATELSPATQKILDAFLFVNFFWTVANLLPVMPLDGGQLMRVVFEGIWGPKGVGKSMFVSMIISATAAVGFFLIGGILPGALFFIFAFQNFQSWRSSRFMSSYDQKDEHREAIGRIEELIRSGDRDAALPLLEELIGRAKTGVIHDLACQYLAIIVDGKGEHERAYFLLKPLEGELAPETQLILHRAAFEVGDYGLVRSLASQCYQFEQTAEVAVRNGMAAAESGDIEATVGWLEAALDHGLENIKEITAHKVFNQVRSHPNFVALSKE